MSRLRGADGAEVEAREEVYRAMIRFRETGEAQPLPASIESAGISGYLMLGQTDAAVETLPSSFSKT